MSFQKTRGSGRHGSCAFSSGRFAPTVVPPRIPAVRQPAGARYPIPWRAMLPPALSKRIDGPVLYVRIACPGGRIGWIYRWFKT